MTGAEAADVLEYLGRYPQTEDVLDVQLSRIIQMLQGIGGKSNHIDEIRLRGTAKTEEDIAEDWIRWIDERENRIKNRLQGS